MIESPIHSVLIAAGELSPLVQDLGLCIVASAVFGVVFERLRIPTIAALLGAGVLLGPIGLQLVHSQSNIETIANLHSRSLAGRLVYPVADLFLVQWESMLELYPKAVYAGRVL